MTRVEPIAILAPLVVGAGAFVSSILIHALALNVSIRFVRHERIRGRTATGFWIDVAIVALAVALALVAHLIEIALFAGLFVLCGEFETFGAAYYHSAVNYTTLGYGDVIMSPSWRLLGPLEAANGALMFGVSTAAIFGLVLRLIKARFLDLSEYQMAAKSITTERALDRSESPSPA